MSDAKKIVRMIYSSIWVLLLVIILYVPLLFEQDAPFNAITIFCWPDAFDELILQQFEQETGIKVFLRFYESNEELLVKMRATKGKGYDIIMPSDYAVAQLIKENLIQKLDKQRIPCFSCLEPFLIDHYYDPGNNYSLPFEWGVYGIGIDKQAFKKSNLPESWSLIFPPADATQAKYIVMVDDPREAISIGANYLYGEESVLNETHITSIQKLLINQRPYVQAYTSLRPDYFLATKNASLVVCPAAYVARALRINPDVDFIVPQEGSFVTIENFAIPICSRKSDLVYQFFNFIYRPEIMMKNYKAFMQFPATHDALVLVSSSDLPYNKPLQIALQSLRKIHFFRHDIPDPVLNNLWITVKTS